MSAAEKTLQQKLADAWNRVWEEHSGAPVSDLWVNLSDEELYAVTFFLWAHHQDAVADWSRRQMRKADPSR